MLSPDFRIGVWTQEPAHRFAGESIIIFLSNEDTQELAPGFFISKPVVLRLELFKNFSF
jgi:hypothetical protein